MRQNRSICLLAVTFSALSLFKLTLTIVFSGEPRQNRQNGWKRVWRVLNVKTHLRGWLCWTRADFIIHWTTCGHIQRRNVDDVRTFQTLCSRGGAASLLYPSHRPSLFLFFYLFLVYAAHCLLQSPQTLLDILISVSVNNTTRKVNNRFWWDYTRNKGVIHITIWVQEFLFILFYFIFKDSLFR